MRQLTTFCFALLAILAASAPAYARSEYAAGGKLLLTNGVSTVEGSAGGGLATWAVIAGNETDAGVGGTAHTTLLALPAFTLSTYGGAVGIRDRVELSYAHQAFDTRDAGTVLGLGRGFTFKQDVFGAKLRLAGNAIYDQDKVWPQLSIGAQYKRSQNAAVISAVGGRAADGVDVYAAATKLLLRHSLLLNATIRMTRANQFGLLGFGGDRDRAYAPQIEVSSAYMLSRRLVIGAEYRSKPSNLGFAREDGAADIFAAFAVSHHATLTAAYVDLGSIATFRSQRGLFLSLQLGI